jgi:hypothetical protein
MIAASILLAFIMGLVIFFGWNGLKELKAIRETLEGMIE